MPHPLPCSRRQEEGPATIVVVGHGLVALVLGGGGHGVRDDAKLGDFHIMTTTHRHLVMDELRLLYFTLICNYCHYKSCEYCSKNKNCDDNIKLIFMFIIPETYCKSMGFKAKTQGASHAESIKQIKIINTTMSYNCSFFLIFNLLQ